MRVSEEGRTGKLKVLLIKLRHIGDSLLLTPTIVALQEQLDGAEVWVLTRRGSDSILGGCPGIHRILATVGTERKHRFFSSIFDDLRLIRELRGQEFDYAFELSESERGRWFLAMCGAKHKVANFTTKKPGSFVGRKFEKVCDFSGYLGHAVSKDFCTVQSVLPLSEPIPPLCFSRERVEATPFDDALGKFAVIHPGTRWSRKRWETGKWIEVGKHLLTRLDQVVISCGGDPEEVSLAAEIQRNLGERALNSRGKLNWRQVAGLLYRAEILVGLDTAVTHLAAACGCPSVVIWGPSFEGHWRPWRAPHRLVLPPGFAEIRRMEGDVSEFQKRKTKDITVAAVLGAVEELAREAASRDRVFAPTQLGLQSGQGKLSGQG